MHGQTFSKAYVPLSGGMALTYASGGAVYYKHLDWLGSYRLASTATRTISFDGAYGPFGEVYWESGSGTTYSFTNQSGDITSGGSTADLYDFPSREYGIQGRWPSPDPSGIAAANSANPQSWNRYAYVLNNPLASFDPSGLTPKPACLSMVRGHIHAAAQCIDTPFGGGSGNDSCTVDCGGTGAVEYPYAPPDSGSDDGCADPEGCDQDPNSVANCDPSDITCVENSSLPLTPPPDNFVQDQWEALQDCTAAADSQYNQALLQMSTSADANYIPDDPWGGGSEGSHPPKPPDFTSAFLIIFGWNANHVYNQQIAACGAAYPLAVLHP